MPEYPLVFIAALRAAARALDTPARCCEHAQTAGRGRVESRNAPATQGDAFAWMSLDGVLTAARAASGM